MYFLRKITITYGNIVFIVPYMHYISNRKYMRVNNGISLLWYVMCDIWSLKVCKPFSYCTLVLISSKNEITMFFATSTAYQTYWRICLKQISALFWNEREKCPFWRHFCSTILGAKCFLKPNVWKC